MGDEAKQEFGFFIENWMAQVAGAWPTMDEAFQSAKYVMAGMRVGNGGEVKLGRVVREANGRWTFLSK